MPLQLRAALRLRRKPAVAGSAHQAAFASRSSLRQQRHLPAPGSPCRHYHGSNWNYGGPAPSNSPLRRALLVAISAGVIFSGYSIKSGYPALGLRPWRQDPDADDFEEYWADITRGLPDECCKALWEAVLASSGHDAYPTNAAYHLVRGMSHLGDVYDESWDRVLYEVVTLLLGEFGVHRGEWAAACAILERVCSHLERRAEANLSELAERGSATGPPARDAILRESRNKFLEMVVISKYGLYRRYERQQQSSGRAIQEEGDKEPSDDAAHADQVRAITSHGDDEVAHAATTELLMQAADFIIRQLPPSREYAANPEKIAFLKWRKRADVFFDAASVKQDEEHHVTAAYYFMQCLYQLPENTIPSAFNAARICHALADCFASAFLQDMSYPTDPERRDLEEQKAREECVRNAFHIDLKQLHSSRPRELLWYALHWSHLAVHEAKEYARGCGDSAKANQKALPDRTSLEEQEQEDMFLFQRPKGPAHSAYFLLSCCYRTRSAILSLCGLDLDALEAARLALDSATRSEDHKLVAGCTRLVSDIEQEIAEEEEEMDGEGEDDNDEAEGDETKPNGRRG